MAKSYILLNLNDSNLNFSYHINSISNKLGRAIGLLDKIPNYVSKETLRSIYFGIFFFSTYLRVTNLGIYKE